jgi:hypothetical protein
MKIKKIFSNLLIITLAVSLVAPLPIFATIDPMTGGFIETSRNTIPGSERGAGTSIFSQTGGQGGGGQQGGGGGAGQAGGQLLSCSAGAVLASLLQGVISGIGGALTSLISPEVPTADNNVRAKESGIGILGIPLMPSWDAIAQCLGNIIVTYLSQSAIQWAQSGFQGSPAFLDGDISTFTGQIKDQVTSQFIQQVTQGLGQYDPYLQTVTRNILNEQLQTGAQRYGYGYQTGQNSPIDQILQGAMGNNYLRTYNTANQQLSYAQGTAVNDFMTQANWGSGHLPARGPAGEISVPASTVKETIFSQGVLLPLFNVLFSKLDSNGFASLAQFMEAAINQIIGKVLTPKNKQQGSTRVQDSTSGKTPPKAVRPEVRRNSDGSTTLVNPTTGQPYRQ